MCSMVSFMAVKVCSTVPVQSVGVGDESSRASRSAAREPSRAWSKSSSIGTRRLASRADAVDWVAGGSEPEVDQVETAT